MGGERGLGLGDAHTPHTQFLVPCALTCWVLASSTLSLYGASELSHSDDSVAQYKLVCVCVTLMVE